jgi:hypothetical protein
LKTNFEGFTFQGGGNDATRKLGDCLWAKGVYIPKDRKLITTNLELVLKEYQEWPADDKERSVQEANPANRQGKLLLSFIPYSKH